MMRRRRFFNQGRRAQPTFEAPPPSRSARADARGQSPDRFAARFERFMAPDDDMVSVVLKGHLLLVEAASEAARAGLAEPSAVDWQGLGARRVIDLLAAARPDRAPASLIEALLAFNALRNAVAHALEHPRLSQKLAAAVDAHRAFAAEAGLAPSAGLDARAALRRGVWDMVTYLAAAPNPAEPAAWLDAVARFAAGED